MLEKIGNSIHSTIDKKITKNTDKYILILSAEVHG